MTEDQSYIKAVGENERLRQRVAELEEERQLLENEVTDQRHQLKERGERMKIMLAELGIHNIPVCRYGRSIMSWFDETGEPL